VTDGVRRLVGYRQIGDLPLVVGVGRSTADVFADWRQYAFSIGLLVAALWVVVIYLIFQIRQRGEAEINLAVLATTDELTGLARVRERLAELCRAKGVREAKLSIGVAAVVPQPAENHGVLLAAVDQALYRAKAAGRNRIEKVQIRRDKPVLIAHTFPAA
jgi:Diguanylate cyclase, GGDEF domain